MLAALLLAGIIAAPLSSAALFVPVPGPRRVAGAWPTTRRFALALLGTIVLAVVVYAVLAALKVADRDGAVALVVACLVWLPVTRRWNARAHLAWSSSILLFVAYLGFILQWTLQSGLSPLGTAGGLLLWAFEIVASVMAAALGTEHWRRRVTSRLTHHPPAPPSPSAS